MSILLEGAKHLVNEPYVPKPKNLEPSWVFSSSYYPLLCYPIIFVKVEKVPGMLFKSLIYVLCLFVSLRLACRRVKRFHAQGIT